MSCPRFADFHGGGVGTDSHSRCGKSRKIKAIDGSMVYKGNSCNKGEWTLVEAWRKDVRG